MMRLSKVWSSTEELDKEFGDTWTLSCQHGWQNPAATLKQQTVYVRGQRVGLLEITKSEIAMSEVMHCLDADEGEG